MGGTYCRLPVLASQAAWVQEQVQCGAREQPSGLQTVASLPPIHRGMEIIALRLAQKL